MRKPTSVARYSIDSESSVAKRARGPQTGGRLYGTGYHDGRGADRGLGRERPLHLRVRAQRQRRGGRGGTGHDDPRDAAPAVWRAPADAARARDRDSFPLDESLSRGKGGRGARGQRAAAAAHRAERLQEGPRGRGDLGPPRATRSGALETDPAS